ncbi:MAG: tRNA pseudouridine(38-40) synthase TruA [Prolixibacteraceae bacterium]
MRYFVQLSYDGTDYHGWQVQKNAHSVQEEFEKALSVICREQTEVVGAGRTDTGVHASLYMAHFDSLLEFPDHEKTVFKLNCLLPEDIAVHQIFKVRPDAHARFDATYREYKYYISRLKDPFTVKYADKENRQLDLDKMNEAAKTLFDYTDFTSFSKLGSDAKTNNCVIYKAFWEEKEGQYIFTIRADRFLRNMVRAIVGTLLEVGLGKKTIDEFRRVIDQKDRSSAGASVSAKGLFLVDIGYPDNIKLEDQV